ARILDVARCRHQKLPIKLRWILQLDHNRHGCPARQGNFGLSRQIPRRIVHAWLSRLSSLSQIPSGGNMKAELTLGIGKSLAAGHCYEGLWYRSPFIDHVANYSRGVTRLWNPHRPRVLF